MPESEPEPRPGAREVRIPGGPLPLLAATIITTMGAPVSYRGTVWITGRPLPCAHYPQVGP